MNKLRVVGLFAVAISFLFTAGCVESTQTRSAKGLYPPKPGPVNIQGSNKQHMDSRVYPFTFEDVYQATGDMLFRRGLTVEEKNETAGTIIGNGYWQTVCGAGPCKMNITFIAYVEEVDDKPTTRLTITLDRHDMIAWGAEASVVNDMLIDTQKILATY